MRDLRRLGREALGLDDLTQLPTQCAVNARGDVAKLRFFSVHTDHDGIVLDCLQRPPADVDLHAPPPAASAAARRIMSSSPSVVSKRFTSSIGTQRTSAASSPAVIVSSSDSGKAR